MRTVLNWSAGRATLILVTAGMVGSAALPAVPALARAVADHHPHAHVAAHVVAKHAHRRLHDSNVRLGSAVAYVRGKDGIVHRIR
jgi:hypothetical protein